MENPNTTPKTRNTKTTRLVIDWNEVHTNHFVNGRGNLKTIATAWGVSAPTAMKLLREHYGAQLISKRGRSGGLALISVMA